LRGPAACPAAVVARVRRLQVPLTPPQVRAMQVLVDQARDGRAGAGLSLSELSRRMGLAHSRVAPRDPEERH